MLSYLEAVGMLVSDQQRALDFYANQSGFIKINDEEIGEGARWIIVAAPGSQTGLILSKKMITHRDLGQMGPVQLHIRSSKPASFLSDVRL